ncbi:Transmembrane protease serine 6 [Folsomia candida]|uniref:Transmembrane protease serine 6 n=1 Tax=Folsomia candida TaxID=158441 RepID=A0A226F3X2_FOLCA|nr:Transmembrane protease serine 6 [Folsomia candida]
MVIPVFVVKVSSNPHERYFVPTQEQFVAQQSQSLVHHNKAQGIFPTQSFGWSNFPFAASVSSGAASSVQASANANANANAVSGISFGFPPTNPGGGLQIGWGANQPQFFGGAFGLGFGFGGGWYNPYPANPFLGVPGNIQHSQQNLQFQQQIQSSAGGSAGFHFNKPSIDLLLSYPEIPTLLKPSQTGWDTSYNIPCGTYQIQPFVRANLRLGTSSSPVGNVNGKRKRRSSFNFPFRDDDSLEKQTWSSSQRQPFISQDQRGFPSFFPPPLHHPVHQAVSVNAGPAEPGGSKTCSWTFNSDGTCKLKFKCVWFQLPALVSCTENSLLVTDNTPNLNNTFCGNRKPRKVYSSSNGKLILTFRSHATSALPAVFDCAVTCSLESSPENGHKPQSKVISAPLRNEANVTTSTENDFTLALSSATSGKDIHKEAAGGVTEKPRIRIGDCRCGVRDDHYLSKGRIVGGHPATPAEFGWTVALVRTSSSPRSTNGRPFCGGSLISDRYVITAAHCVSNNKVIREPRSVPARGVQGLKELFQVLLIEHDVTRLDDVPGGSVRFGVDKILVHPLYNNVSFDYDVALLRLDRPIEFTSSQSAFYRYDTFDFHSRRRFIPEVEARPHIPRPTPICLPSDKSESLVDKYATITGWGLQQEGGNPSDELQKATVQVFNDSFCKELYKEYNYPVTDSMMCAGYMAGEVDACVGDSGGGLIVKDNEKYILAGITSWGRGCGRKKQPGVYTKIHFALIEWIRKEASDGVWCV